MHKFIVWGGAGSLWLLAGLTAGLQGQGTSGTSSPPAPSSPPAATAGPLAPMPTAPGPSHVSPSPSAAADVPAGRAGPSAPGPAKKELRPKAAARLPIAPEREAAALTFVQRNHPELAELLAYLKTNQPEEYQRAIRDLVRVVERLGAIQERDPLQYELEVALWTAQSRVQLLAARAKMEQSDELVRLLREALGAQMDARLALLHHERSKVAERLSRLDAEIAQRQQQREAMIQRQLETLLASVEAEPTAGAKNLPAKAAPARASSKTVPKTPRKNAPAR